MENRLSHHYSSPPPVLHQKRFGPPAADRHLSSPWQVCEIQQWRRRRTGRTTPDLEGMELMRAKFSEQSLQMVNMLLDYWCRHIISL